MFFVEMFLLGVYLAIFLLPIVGLLVLSLVSLIWFIKFLIKE